MNVVSAMPGNGYATQLQRVFVLAMAASRLHLTPSVAFHLPDEVSDLHESISFIPISTASLRLCREIPFPTADAILVIQAAFRTSTQIRLFNAAKADSTWSRRDW